MKNFFKLFGIIAIVSIIGFGMLVVGCDDGTTNDNGGENGDNSGQNLPAASGINAVSGKMYYEWLNRTVFSVTTDGASNGTYVVTAVDDGTYASGVKYTYTTQVETGTYSWNEGVKTVTLKPEKIILPGSGGSAGGSDGSETIYSEYRPLKDKSGYRSEIQAMMDAYIRENGQAAVNQQLSSMGFSSVSAYLNFAVNETFGNTTYTYLFSADNTTLFLEEALPANKGTNELSGQTYYGLKWDSDQDKEVKDENIKYVFTASGYTFIESLNGTVQNTTIGSYAYDSSQKRIWLKPETINGKNRTAYFADQTPYSGHHFPDDNAYRASRTNSQFRFYSQPHPYNPTNKTISWYD